MVYDIQPHIIGIAESWADNDQARIQLLAKGEVVKIMELQLLMPQYQISATTYMYAQKQATATSTNELA